VFNDLQFQQNPSSVNKISLIKYSVKSYFIQRGYLDKNGGRQEVGESAGWDSYLGSNDKKII
jgi:hypothetical protein